LAFVRFHRTNLTGADFTGADLRGANCIDSRLKAAIFLYARLQQSTFTDCDLAEADFQPFAGSITHLQDVTFTSCSLNGAKFIGAELQRSTFTNCDLAEAHFEEANLEGAD